MTGQACSIETKLIDGMLACRGPCTNTWTSTQITVAESTAPIRAAITPSMMNGVWMKRLDAPTSRMIPISRRRENAESRIVVAIRSTAATSISAAMPRAV